MKIFNFISNKKSSKRVETIPTFVGGNRSVLCFSRSEILDCQKKITDRLSNAVISAKTDFLECKNIISFVNDNRLQILQRMFTDGYVIINTRGDYGFCNDHQRRMRNVDGDITFELMSSEVVIVSETFKATGHSDKYFLSDKIKYLDTINSSDFNLIENYGAMGIVSPESDSSIAGAEFTDEDIENLQESYAKHYGVKFGKWSLMFVPRPTKFNPINLPISSLQLSEKRIYILRSIFETFGIPKELSAYFENSTYANRDAAELDFYSGTITKWANVMVDIVSLMYNKIREEKTYLTANEFWFDFVGVLALQKEQQKQKQTAREEFDFWQKVKREAPEMSETANNRIKTLIENL